MNDTKPLRSKQNEFNGAMGYSGQNGPQEDLVLRSLRGAMISIRTGPFALPAAAGGPLGTRFYGESRRTSLQAGWSMIRACFA